MYICAYLYVEMYRYVNRKQQREATAIDFSFQTVKEVEIFFSITINSTFFRVCCTTGPSARYHSKQNENRNIIREERDDEGNGPSLGTSMKERNNNNRKREATDLIEKTKLVSEKSALLIIIRFGVGKNACVYITITSVFVSENLTCVCGCCGKLVENHLYPLTFH